MRIRDRRSKQRRAYDAASKAAKDAADATKNAPTPVKVLPVVAGVGVAGAVVARKRRNREPAAA